LYFYEISRLAIFEVQNLSDINIGAATILGFHILFLFCNFLEVALTATYFVELHTLHLHPVNQKSDSLSRRI